MVATVDFDIVHKNQTEPISIRVKNTSTEDLVDVAGTSSFSLINIANDTSEDSGTFEAAGSAKMVRVAEGIYNYSFDAAAYPYEYLLATRCVLANETSSQDIYVKSSSARSFAYAAQLRSIVDKARKSTSDDIVNMNRADNQPSLQFFYGYESKQLIYYLERGVQYLNAIPPYTGLTVDLFPFPQYGAILLDAATIAALEAQGIFAIDTDFNYALGGNSLVIDHYSKLSGMVSQILGRFTKTAISWKQQYRSKGLVMYQFMPGGVRAMRQLNAMPSGFWSRLLSAVYQ